jgi:hypothetical protein
MMNMVHELRQIAFDVEPDTKQGSADKRQIHDRDFKKLGFQVYTNLTIFVLIHFLTPVLE